MVDSMNFAGAAQKRLESNSNGLGAHGLSGQKNAKLTLGAGAGAGASNSPVPGSQPAPGVTGVTPGAVERRMTPPPTAQVQQTGSPMRGANPQFSAPNSPMMNMPDLQGPARGQLQAPTGNLENFLRNLQNRRSQER